MTQETQEGRRSTVGTAVTAQEKWFVELVAKKEGRDVSSLVREAISDIIERGRRINDVLELLPETHVVDPAEVS